MSRTKKEAKAPGYEYWSRRPMAGSNPCALVKKITHKIERQHNKPTADDFDEQVIRTDGGPMTMGNMYGDGSGHEACQDCGMCGHCGDCKCVPA